tara:strand:+ start:302 stop:472 length:171 start_codon:yes stop_codon:yes gene_type:complete
MDILSSFLTYFFGALMQAVIVIIGYWLAKWFAPENRFEFAIGFFVIALVVIGFSGI